MVEGGGAPVASGRTWCGAVGGSGIGGPLIARCRRRCGSTWVCNGEFMLRAARRNTGRGGDGPTLEVVCDGGVRVSGGCFEGASGWRVGGGARDGCYLEWHWVDGGW